MTDDLMTIERLKKIADSIRKETRPIKFHTDPAAIQDCWNEINDIADTLFTKAEVKKMLFRVSELTANVYKNEKIPHMCVNYDQIMENRGGVVNKPKDH